MVYESLSQYLLAEVSGSLDRSAAAAAQTIEVATYRLEGCDELEE